MLEHLEQEILSFINLNFANNHKLLKTQIDFFLEFPEKTNLFNEKFRKNIETPIQFQSLNSIKQKRNKGEVGDISDVWTFFLNKELNETEFSDFEFEKHLKSGKELHTCKVWINWFLNVFYIETSYLKKSKNIEETGILNLSDEFEIDIYDKIIEVLEENNHKKIDFTFLNKKVEKVKTDINDSPTVFNCLFSDLILPVKNERITRNKISDLEIVLIEKFDENKTVLNKKVLFGNGNYNLVRVDFDANNKFLKTLSYKEILKE